MKMESCKKKQVLGERMNGKGKQRELKREYTTVVVKQKKQ